MIKHVFLDLDDTILDFHKAEEVALEKTLRHFSIPPAHGKYLPTPLIDNQRKINSLFK